MGPPGDLGRDKGFVGGTKDSTGLAYRGAREYDPTLGRFISVDPIMDLSRPDQWNGYSYANDNPVTLSDPNGLEPRPWHDPNYEADDCKNSSSWECHPGTTPGRDGNGGKTGGGSSIGRGRADSRNYTSNPQLGLNSVNLAKLRRAYDAGYQNHSFVFPDDDGVLRQSCVGRLGCQVASTYLRKAEADGLTAGEIYAAKALAIGWCSEHANACSVDDQLGDTWSSIPFMLAGGAAQMGKPGGVTSGARAPSAPGSRTPSQAGITPAEAARIQNAANRTGQEIVVVGSRAEGTASARSDWDYVLSGPSRARHSASSLLPRGSAGGSQNGRVEESGIDIFQSYNPSAPSFTRVDVSKPHVMFKPQAR